MIADVPSETLERGAPMLWLFGSFVTIAVLWRWRLLTARARLIGLVVGLSAFAAGLLLALEPVDERTLEVEVASRTSRPLEGSWRGWTTNDRRHDTAELKIPGRGLVGGFHVPTRGNLVCVTIRTGRISGAEVIAVVDGVHCAKGRTREN